MMEETNLPHGWKTTQIGSLCDLHNGRSFKQAEWSKSGLPIIRIQNLNKKDAPFNYFDGLLADKHLVKNGDLLFAWSGTPGTSFGTHEWEGENAALNQHIFKIEFSLSHIYKSFFRYAIDQRLVDLIGSANGGVGLRHVTKKTFENTSISFPPLAEQKVIADKLDTLLAQVDTTKARLEQIPNILKRFRQSVLAAAVSGKLTEEWRGKGSAQMEPFDAINDSLTDFKQLPLKELPDKWLWLRFDQVATIASNLKDPLEHLNEIHIAPNHIESWSGQASGYQTIEEDKVKSSKHRFFKGQIIYSKIRPYLAKAIIADFNGLCSADMYPIDSKINTKYLFRWILTHEFTDWASNAESRSVLPKINQKDLGRIPVPTPPLEEQTEIVRRVEELFAFADSVEQKANAALDRVNNLTQSILAKAFRGELTAGWRAANPDLITGENSAEALLEKIKAEREAMKPKKATRKKSTRKTAKA